MSYELKKPYTDIQRADFIVEYNHNQGLEIVETGEVLYALEADEIMVDDVPMVDPDYEEKQVQKEKERISHLKLTKRVFALALQQFGLTYAQLKELIATNEQAQLEWDLCVELERSNPLLDIMASQLGVTPAQLDYIFRKGNGEEVEPHDVDNKSEDVNNSDKTGNKNVDNTAVLDGENVDNI